MRKHVSICVSTVTKPCNANTTLLNGFKRLLIASDAFNTKQLVFRFNSCVEAHFHIADVIIYHETTLATFFSLLPAHIEHIQRFYSDRSFNPAASFFNVFRVCQLQCNRSSLLIFWSLEQSNSLRASKTAV